MLALRGIVLIGVGVVAAALVMAAFSAGHASAAVKPLCAAHLDRGYGYRMMLVITGRPVALIHAECRAVAKGPGWEPGWLPRTGVLVCGAIDRDFPGVNAALFATRKSAPVVRSMCSAYFPRKSWRRYR